MSYVSIHTATGATFCECIIAQNRPVGPILDHDRLVANAGLILPATLMARLGLEALINQRMTTGSSRPGRSTTSTCCGPGRPRPCCRSG